MTRKDTIQSEGPPSEWSALSSLNWKWLDDVRLLLQGKEGRQNFINTITDTKTNNLSIKRFFVNDNRGDARFTVQPGAGLDEPYIGPDGELIVPGDIIAGSLSVVSSAAVSAYQTAAQSIADVTATTLIFNAVYFDANSTMNLTTGKWTPTSAGVYRVTGSVGFEATNVYADKYVALGIAKNGVTLKSTKIHTSVAADIVVEANGLIEMNGTTDYLEVSVEHNFGFSTPTWGVGYATYFDVNKVI